MSALSRTHRIPRSIWVGAVAAVVYVTIAAGVGDLLGGLAGDDQSLAMVLGTWIPVAALILAGLVLIRRAGWTREVWRAPSPFTERRRWWLLAIPVGLAVQTILILVAVPWADRAVSLVVVFLVGSLLVGIGEELYFRGIFRTAVLGHHGELAALLLTSLAFGLAHTVKFITEGLPVAATALDVAFLAMNGALFYGALRATGTLWVPVVLHGLGDFGRFMQQGGEEDTSAQTFGSNAADAIMEYLLIGLSLALVVSLVRERLRARQPTSRTRTPNSSP